MEINRIYNIALFGGTFDPFHMGHYELLKNFYEEQHPDKIYVIPTGHPYFKEKAGKKVSSAEDRIGMTRAGLLDLDIPCEVSTYETDKDTPSYSVETIGYFREKGIPEDADCDQLKIWFLCGSDLLFQIDKWNRSGEILRSVILAVIPRGDDDMDEILLRKRELEAREEAQIYISGYRGRNISSTMIREDPVRYRELVPPGTYEYIRSHGLYGLDQ